MAGMHPNNTDETRMRLEKADDFADEIITIADGVADGDKDALAHAKLRIDVRMWLMARLAPHLYGASAPKQQDQDPKVSFVMNTQRKPKDA